MLKNKKILLIAPDFFGYEDEIIAELTALGADVSFFRDYLTGTRNDLLRVLRPGMFEKRMENYRKHIIDFAKGNSSVDYVFVIKGVLQNEMFLKNLRAILPQARFIMYQWDSERNYKYKNFISFYDRVLSFDKEDAERIGGVLYRPLFYIRSYEQAINVQRDIGLSCCASYTDERARILSELKKTSMVRCHFALYMKPLSFLKYWLRDGKRPSFAILRKMNKAQILDIVSRSKAVVDIHSPTQNGLTIRTFEVLAAGCRLLTTNVAIKSEPFYNSEHIILIDREFPAVNMSVLDSENAGGLQIDMSLYRIDNWLKRIFDV